MSKKKYINGNAISLFSGMGGDTLGMENAGFKVIGFNEMKKAAIETHKSNFKHSKLIGNDNNNDILKIPDDIFLKYKNKVNLIFAGFPCQGFSQAGKKLPDDPRNTMFKEFVRATNLIKPKYIIGENVDALLKRQTADGDTFINIIKNEFNNIGYDIYFKVLKASSYNIPQDRKRLIIVGIQYINKTYYEFPQESNITPNLINIIKFSMKGALRIDNEHYDMSKEIPEECIITDMDNTEDEISEEIHPFLKLRGSVKNFEYKDKIYKNLLSFGKRGSPNHIEIIDIRKPCKTIICSYDHQPRLFVPIRNKNGYFIRPILPDELKQIQGFPQDYKLYGTWKEQIVQIGNAAPPPMIEAVAKQLVV